MRMLATLSRHGPPLLLATGLALLPVATRAAGEAATLRFEEGVAKRPDSGVELYREQHWLRRAGTQSQQRLVLYRCPDGTAFGRKQVDYRNSATAPEFVFEDRRSGYREGLRRGAATELFYRANADSPELTAKLRSAPSAAGLESVPSVADAGFDEFVRRHWSALLAGNAVPLRFALPSRLRSMAFSLQRAGQATVAGEPAWIFRLKLDGWLGLIAPRIEVSYGQVSRRLLRFEGLSNLRDDAGDKPLLARIDFATPARPATEAQWQAALQAPLSACRAGR